MCGYGDRSSQLQQQHIQILPPPSMWTQAAAQQHVAPTKVKLSPFGTKDTYSWLTPAKFTFNPSRVADPQLRFELVLHALPEEVIQQVQGILHTVDDIANPYRALKIRLLDLFTPKPMDLCQKIINRGDLGNRRPSQLMEDMLSLLPPGSLRECCSRHTSSTGCLRTSTPTWWLPVSPLPLGRWQMWQTTLGLMGTTDRATTSSTGGGSGSGGH